MDGCLSALQKKKPKIFNILLVLFVKTTRYRSVLLFTGKRKTKQLHTQTRNPVGDKLYIIKNVSTAQFSVTNV